MDDDGFGSGLSGFAFHELGRQSAGAEQVQADAVANFAARLRGERPVNVGALIAQNQALWQQNQELIRRNEELQAEVHTLHFNHRRLREWADLAEAALVRLGVTFGPRAAP